MRQRFHDDQRAGSGRQVGVGPRAQGSVHVPPPVDADGRFDPGEGAARSHRVHERHTAGAVPYDGFARARVHRRDQEPPVGPVARADQSAPPREQGPLGLGVGVVERDPAHPAPGLPGFQPGLAEDGEHGGRHGRIHLPPRGRRTRPARRDAEPVQVLTAGQQRGDDRTGRRTDGQIGVAEIHPLAAQPRGQPGHPRRAGKSSRAQYECAVQRRGSGIGIHVFIPPAAR
ncbi:hypothetical protein Sros01_50290 [Streptomyces roseochromogenus]|nr:hypothetical protein Sros01_50290 [Streptomyces roseochromogenus]